MTITSVRWKSRGRLCGGGMCAGGGGGGGAGGGPPPPPPGTFSGLNRRLFVGGLRVVLQFQVIGHPGEAELIEGGLAADDLVLLICHRCRCTGEGYTSRSDGGRATASSMPASDLPARGDFRITSRVTPGSMLKSIGVPSCHVRPSVDYHASCLMTFSRFPSAEPFNFPKKFRSVAALRKGLVSSDVCCT
jgi:hypothetical protein